MVETLKEKSSTLRNAHGNLRKTCDKALGKASSLAEV